MLAVDYLALAARRRTSCSDCLLELLYASCIMSDCRFQDRCEICFRVCSSEILVSFFNVRQQCLFHRVDHRDSARKAI